MKTRPLLLVILAALVALMALFFMDGRSDHDRIRLVTRCELPQARVLRTMRGGDNYAVFFELPAADAEALCRSLPTRGGWQPLLAGHSFGMGDDAADDLTGLTGQYARVEGNYSGLAYLLRLDDGRTLVAVLTGILY